MVYKKTLYPLSFILFALCNVNCGGGGTQQPSLVKITDQQITVPTESCRTVTHPEKINSLTGAVHDFYTLAENTTRFPIPNSKNVYVVGDIHGSWKMVLYALVNTGLMEYDTPWKKTVVIQYQGRDLEVEIPNLKYKPGSPNKLILVGDYIAKSTPENEQITIALLTDTLRKMKDAAPEKFIAILGNHDLEAVNKVHHGGYPTEKNYEGQIRQMVAERLLVPTYYHQGIWYSHSYLTEDDVDHFNRNSVNFLAINPPNPLHYTIAQTSQNVNHFVVDHILKGTLSSTWLASPAEGKKSSGPYNFFYVMSMTPADGITRIGSYLNFPMIMGHLSDLRRKELRVLTEAPGGAASRRFIRRSHILCTDTSIYDSFKKGTPATFLKIDYDAGARSVQFNSCTVPTR